MGKDVLDRILKELKGNQIKEEPSYHTEHPSEIKTGPCGMKVNKCPGPQYALEYVPKSYEDDCTGCLLNPIYDKII